MAAIFPIVMNARDSRLGCCLISAQVKVRGFRIEPGEIEAEFVDRVSRNALGKLGRSDTPAPAS